MMPVQVKPGYLPPFSFALALATHPYTITEIDMRSAHSLDVQVAALPSITNAFRRSTHHGCIAVGQKYTEAQTRIPVVIVYSDFP